MHPADTVRPVVAPAPLTLPPVRIVEGRVEAALTALVDERGWRRAALVCGPRFAATTGIEARLTGLGVDVVLCPRAGVHAPLAEVEELAQQVAAVRPDVLISAGGGSSHDAAKGVAVLLEHGGELEQHCLTYTPPGPVRHRTPQARLPIVTIPSTLSGSEANGAAGFTDRDGVGKRVLAHPSLTPAAVIVDDAVLASTPEGLLHGSAMNALNHCVEGLASRRLNVLSQALLSQAMVELAASTAQPVTDRTRASIGSALAGVGLTGSWLGLAHAIGHVLGARYRVPHGWCHAVLAGPVVRFNAVDAEARHAATAALLDLPPTSDALADWLDARSERWKLPRRLRELGVEAGELPGVAAAAFHDHDSFYNPRRIDSPDEIEQLLRMLL